MGYSVLNTRCVNVFIFLHSGLETADVTGALLQQSMHWYTQYRYPIS